jgi:hypothetical protein
VEQEAIRQVEPGDLIRSADEGRPSRVLPICLVVGGAAAAVLIGGLLAGLMNLAGEGESVPTHAADLMVLAPWIVFPAAVVMGFRLRLGATLALAVVAVGLVGIATDPGLAGKGEVVAWWLVPSALLVSGAGVAWWRARRAYRPLPQPCCGKLPIALALVGASLAVVLAIAVWSLGGSLGVDGTVTNWLDGVVIAWALSGALAFLSAVVLWRRAVLGAVMVLAAAVLGLVAPWLWVGSVLDADVWGRLPWLWAVAAVPLLAAASSAAWSLRLGRSAGRA